jgi:hypothetical protein
LVVLALAGVNVRELLESAIRGMERCREEELEKNPGAQIAVFQEVMRRTGRNIGLILPEGLERFAKWWQELVWSLGGEGAKIIPIAEGELSNPERYGKNAAFIHLNVGATFMTPENAGSMNRTPTLRLLKEARYPVREITLSGKKAIGELFSIVEFATALSYLMGIGRFRKPGSLEMLSQAKAVGYELGNVSLAEVLGHSGIEKAELLSEYHVDKAKLDQSKPTKVFVFDIESLFNMKVLRKPTASGMSIEFEVKPNSLAVFEIMNKIVEATKEVGNLEGVRFAFVSNMKCLSREVMAQMLRDYMVRCGLSAEVVTRVVDEGLIIDRKAEGVVDLSGRISTKAVFCIINEWLLGATNGNGIEVNIITHRPSDWKKDGDGKMLERILWVVLEPAKEGKVLSTAAGVVVVIEGKASRWLREFIKATYPEEEAERVLSQIAEDGKVILPAAPVDKNYLERIEAEKRIYKCQA